MKVIIRNKQEGAGLIEVLVALTILAIGLLGVLSMQVTGLKSNQRALFATEVNLLVSDMADRILAYGAAGANDGEYDNLSTTNVDVLADAVANADKAAWALALTNSSLPAVVGDVTWVSNDLDPDDGIDVAGGVYTISLRWNDTRENIAIGTLADDCDTATPIFLGGVAQKFTCYQFSVTL
jgi:type IV pilus assembly protein PilV